MTRTRCLLFFCGLLAVPVAQADIYKCIDDSGHTTYTNDKPVPERKSCVLMSKDQPVTTAPAQKPSGAKNTQAPASFPKVDASTQKSRDTDRLKILETELETETRLLAFARKELADQESMRLGNEKNNQKYLDRIQGFKDKVALHARNIEALNKEIAKQR